MSMKRKILGRRTSGIDTARVLIVMPVPLNYNADIRAAAFCAGAVSRNIAVWGPIPSRNAEDARNLQFIDGLNAKPRFTHFFLLDADTFPYDPYMIEKLLRHNKDVVAGPTPTQRQGKDKWNFKAFDYATVEFDERFHKYWNIVVDDGKGKGRSLRRSDDSMIDELPKKMFRAKYVGGTGILIKRSVIEALPEPYQLTLRDIHGKTMLSEDYYFCEQITTHGYDIWVDPELKSGHNNSVDIGKY